MICEIYHFFPIMDDKAAAFWYNRNRFYRKGVQRLSLSYFYMSFINITALLFLNYLVRKNEMVSGRLRSLFRLSVYTIILVIASEAAGLYFAAGGQALRGLHLFTNMIGFSCSPFIPLLIGSAIHKPQKKLSFILWLPAIINVLFSVASCFSPFIFYVDPANVYRRGPFFGVYIVAYASAAFFLLFETLAATRRYQIKDNFILIFLFCFFVLGTSIQIFFPHLYLTWLSVSFSVILYYAYCCELNQQIDGLTEMLTHRVFENCLEKQRGRRDIAILYFDVDDFKEINDRYGHPFGDQCLQSISLCIRETFSKKGLCFRTGGDEFCVVCEKTRPDEVDLLCGVFLKKIEQLRKNETRLPMVSLGRAFYNYRTDDLDEMIAAADRQMYQFKTSRKKLLEPEPD